MSDAKQILQLNRFDAAGGNLDERTQSLVERRFRAFGQSSVLFYQQPLEIVSAEGTQMFDRNGRGYLDV
ncbi:MAG: aspartate aminotransferase family protein, partial [Comamonas sp.]|nr:aspartate aminotransferase family protein [Comamonas sp.]